MLDHKPDKGYKVKELVIYPGKSLSDQKHFKRSEHWVVIIGSAFITKGKRQFKLNANQSMETSQD